MKELTKAEEQVMHFIWELKKSFLKDIVDAFPEPKPAYTTISTVIRVLVKKGFIDLDQPISSFIPAIAGINPVSPPLALFRSKLFIT